MPKIMQHKWIVWWIASLSAIGCSKEISADEFISFYENKCKSTVQINESTITALPLSSDYEKAKWDTFIGLGTNLVVSVMPSNSIQIEKAFLLYDGKKEDVSILRRISTYEVGNTDIYSLAFSDSIRNKNTYIQLSIENRNPIEIPLKNCNDIRWIQKK